MPKFHFYDIETLDNIFTLTNYIPEENRVDQYYLASDDLDKKLKQEPDLLNKLTSRVNLRNVNFTKDNVIKRDSRGNSLPGNGQVNVYDLHTVQANIHLAKSFGLSNSFNINNPKDTTNLYPNNFRLVCDTDHLDSKTWSKTAIINDYQKALSNHNKSDSDIKSDIGKYTKPQIRNYNQDTDPYLLGYNSDNYDLTILAYYFQQTFFEQFNENSALTKHDYDLYSQNNAGYHYFKIDPPDTHLLRQFNNMLFSDTYIDHMTSSLYKATNKELHPDSTNNDKLDLTNARRIYKNWLLSGRHLDVAKLNVKLMKVGLKRLMGMLGLQILESSKLKPGADHIDNVDQFYELLAYNASDCINLRRVFEHPYYKSNFELNKSMLDNNPMIIYQKQKHVYDADVQMDKVRRDRMLIDSTPAMIATNIVCPYGHLNDIDSVSFMYPEKRKAKELGITPFNVLKQTIDFFKTNVYQPALSKNKQAAQKALTAFNKVMNLYSFIEHKNFNDSNFYYKRQILKAPENKGINLSRVRDEYYTNLLSNFNSFDLFNLYQDQNIKGIYTNIQSNGKYIFLSRDFIMRNKVDYQLNINLTLFDFISYLRRQNNIKSKYANNIQNLLTEYDNLANYHTLNLDSDDDLDQTDSLDYQIFAKHVNSLFKLLFKQDITLETYSSVTAKVISKAKLFKNFKPLCKLYLRPYTAQDLPKDNYALPFFNLDGTASSGYINFSVGGIHGAEYNQKLYQLDLAEYNKQTTPQLDLFGNLEKTNQNLAKPLLFKPNQSNLYELNKRYNYTSIGLTNHEDFSSYYPSMCRMLNIYWNDGIGYDIYGKIYDEKEELGHKMKDPKYTPEQRRNFKNLRQGNKLVLNSTTGKGDSHGQHSPIQMNNNILSMRLIGQMFTWRIGQAQTLAGARVISTNTDGLYTIMSDTKLNDEILKRESKEIHVRIDPERLYLISKDANNRIEADPKTLEITNASGADLGAYNGPTPTNRLSHPAIIDKLLSQYLQEIANPKSKYYDETLMKPFNKDLAIKLIKNDLTKIITEKDPVKRLALKQHYLQFYQNVISSSTGTDRYLFASKKYYAKPNSVNIDSKITQADNLNNQKQLDILSVENLLQSAIDMNFKYEDKDNFKVLQHYNRIFYVDKTIPSQSYHIYVATGRKVPAKTALSRKSRGAVLYNNSSLGKYMLNEFGLNYQKLNAKNKEAKIVKMPSLDPKWHAIIVNQSLESLSEQDCDTIIQHLNYHNYLHLLEKSFVLHWNNNVDYQIAYTKQITKEEKANLD